VRDSLTGTPSWRTAPTPGCSISTTISRARGPRPALGEHTGAALRAAGYSDEEIEALERSGAVAGAGDALPAAARFL